MEQETRTWEGEWPAVVRRRLDDLAVTEAIAVTEGWTNVASICAQTESLIISEFDLTYSHVKRGPA